MLVSAPWRQGAEAETSWQVSAQKERLAELAGTAFLSACRALYRAALFTVAVLNTELPQTDAAYPAVEMYS